jgi:hypothetical protein
MKPAFLWLLFILPHAFLANGQFAVIRDADGFVNVRAGDSIKAKIIGRLHDGEVFVSTFAQNGWVKVYFDPETSYRAKGFEGYIHEDRLLSIEKLPHVPRSGKTLEKGHLKLQNDSVDVEILTAPFRPKQHVIRKDKHGNVQTIDGVFPYGAGDGVPEQKVTSLSMNIRGRAVDIPASAWNDLYEPDLEISNVFFDARTGFIYIVMPANGGNSASGAYEIAWVFKNGRYVTRYIDGF